MKRSAMKYAYLQIFIVFLSAIMFSQANVFSETLMQQEINYSIASSLPTPGPSPQGLAWDGTHLWVSDDSTDTIYKIDSMNGIVIDSLHYPDSDPKGLTWDGMNLWSVFGKTNNMNKLNPESGEILQTLNAVYHNQYLSAPIHGIAWDGSNLLCTYYAGYSSAVITVDVNDGTGHEWFYCAAEDITFDGTFLWNVSLSRLANGNHKGLVIQRALPDRTEISYFRTPGSYPTGLTWDGKYFWLADRGTDTIYQIEPLPTMVESDSSPVPFILRQNYPNPFNSFTLFNFSITYSSNVAISIVDVKGRIVKNILNGYVYPGNYNLMWDSTDNDGKDVSSGIYFYVFENENFKESKKMLLLR